MDAVFLSVRTLSLPARDHACLRKGCERRTITRSVIPKVMYCIENKKFFKKV